MFKAPSNRFTANGQGQGQHGDDQGQGSRPGQHHGHRRRRQEGDQARQEGRHDSVKVTLTRQGHQVPQGPPQAHGDADRQFHPHRRQHRFQNGARHLHAKGGPLDASHPTWPAPNALRPSRPSRVPVAGALPRAGALGSRQLSQRGGSRAAAARPRCRSAAPTSSSTRRASTSATSTASPSRPTTATRWRTSRSAAGNDALGGGVASISVARRGPDGWKSTSADPLASGGSTNGTGFTAPKAFSPDFSSHADVERPADDPGRHGRRDDIYRMDVAGGTSTLMSHGRGPATRSRVAGRRRTSAGSCSIGTAGGVHGRLRQRRRDRTSAVGLS